ncbi:MAG TPA: hypothetical protein P5528_00085 [Steroidobacteraceae bacterium]|nr:hypothetical protein [Steroidobacteraceae bacterium]HRX87815.1 hypothetical protein [Steroidobacteraceae bacterium]
MNTTPRYPLNAAPVSPPLRWQRFLERRGTCDNDYGSRLARARLVYLRRRESLGNWLALTVGFLLIGGSINF